MTNSIEQLSEIIASFFRAEYGDDMTPENSIKIASTLDKISPSDLIFFLENDFTPLTNPDAKFSEKSFFDLFIKLYPSMIEKASDNYSQIFLKGILTPLFNDISNQNKKKLSDWFKSNSKFNLGMTSFINVSLLGKAEFNIARSYNNIDKNLADRYFRKSLSHFLLARDLNIKPNDRFNFGMVGVCHHYIALAAKNPEAQKENFKSAISNLERAEDLGDDSIDHYIYLGLSLFEYACFDNKLSDYFQALSVLNIAFKKDKKSGNTCLTLARCNLNIGINYSLQKDSKGIDYLYNAIDLFSSLLENKHLINENYPEEAIITRRTQALFYLWLSTKEDILILDECISDLKRIVAKDNESTWIHNLINALLEKFVHDRNIDDLNYAKVLSDKKNEKHPIETEFYKQRGRLYLLLANSNEQNPSFEDFSRSIECFQQCIKESDNESQGYLGLAYGLRGLNFNVEEDLRNGIDNLVTSKYNENRESDRAGLLPRLYKRLADLIVNVHPIESVQLFQKSIDILNAKIKLPLSYGNKIQSEITSIIGGTYLYKFNITRDIEDIEKSHSFMSMAEELGMVDTVFFGVFGQVCLSLSRITRNIYLQTDLLINASNYFKKSFDLGNIEQSNFSKWGESLLRLNRVNMNITTLKEALEKFLESFQKGNDSPENLGLIGDCFYQLSRIENPKENLLKALTYKEMAKRKGHESKENFSICGRINLKLYLKTKDVKYFNDGVKSILLSHNIDKLWPWPICQLAEVTRDFSDEIQRKGLLLSTFTDDQSLFKKILNIETNKLWIEGAKLTLSQKDFKQEILGGKSHVFIKKDPYGLISSTFVFKPGDSPDPQFARFKDKGLENLNNEKQRIISFGLYLKKFKKNDFLVPTPLEIFHLDGLIVYSMLRVNGRELGEVLLYSNNVHLKYECIKKTIEYLSIFHSWQPVNSKFENGYYLATNPVRNILNDLGKKVNSSFLIGDSIIKKCSIFKEYLSKLPLVEKKDAHPENWLVTENKNIILIDIEEFNPRYKVLLDDLVQLIDDYPFLVYDNAAWQDRKFFIELYITNLNYYHKNNNLPEFVIHKDELYVAYLILLYLRALFIIGLSERKMANYRISESSLTHWDLRKNHAFNLINFIETVWLSEFNHVECPDWHEMTQDINVIKRTVP